MTPEYIVVPLVMTDAFNQKHTGVHSFQHQHPFKNDRVNVNDKTNVLSVKVPTMSLVKSDSATNKSNFDE